METVDQQGNPLVGFFHDMLPSSMMPGPIYDWSGVQSVQVASVGEPERLIVPWWPRSLGVGQNARNAAALQGKRVELEGLVGFAPFLVVTPEMKALGSAVVIVSTKPLVLSDSPLGAKYSPSYHQVSSGGLSIFISSNVLGDEAIQQVTMALASVADPPLKTFKGNEVFVTVSAPDHWTFEGPSSGLALYAACNGYATPYLWSGALVLEGGVLRVSAVGGMEGKLSMVIGAGRALVTVFHDQLLRLLIENEIPYVSPQLANVGLVANPGTEGSYVVLIDNLAAVTVLSGNVPMGLRLAAPPPGKSQKAGPQVAAFKSPAPGIGPAMPEWNAGVLALHDLTPEMWEAKLQIWASNRWPAGALKAIEQMADSQEKLVPWLPRLAKLGRDVAELKVSETRFRAAYKLFPPNTAKLEGWEVALANLHAPKLSKPEKKEKKKNKAVVAQVHGSLDMSSPKPLSSVSTKSLMKEADDLAQVISTRIESLDLLSPNYEEDLKRLRAAQHGVKKVFDGAAMGDIQVMSYEMTSIRQNLKGKPPAPRRE
jgi:hypothetical protein